MRLSDYILEIGPAKAARKFSVKERTIESWLRRERYPRPLKAAHIVRVSPVTYEGIYAPPPKISAEGNGVRGKEGNKATV